MGYRASFWKENREFIGELPKFYGYLNEKILVELDSIKWLLEHDKLKEELDNCFNDIDCVFANYSHPEIVFTPEEFREFIVLYNSDFIKYRYTIWQPYSDNPDFDINGYDLLEKISWLKELYNDNTIKTIEWG